MLGTRGPRQRAGYWGHLHGILHRAVLTLPCICYWPTERPRRSVCHLGDLGIDFDDLKFTVHDTCFIGPTAHHHHGFGHGERCSTAYGDAAKSP